MTHCVTEDDLEHLILQHKVVWWEYYTLYSSELCREVDPVEEVCPASILRDAHWVPETSIEPNHVYARDFSCAYVALFMEEGCSIAWWDHVLCQRSSDEGH